MKGFPLLVCLVGSCCAASAQTLQVSIDPTQTLSFGMLAVGFKDTRFATWPTFEDVYLVPLTGTFAANTTSTIIEHISDPIGMSMDYYALYASYGGGGGAAPTDAVVSFSAADGPNLLGQPWPISDETESDFLSESFTTDPNYYDNWDVVQLIVMPTMILSAEEANPPSWITPLWATDGSPYAVSGIDASVVGQAGYLVNFSNGTFGGTVTASIIPEPSPAMGLAVGLLGFAFARRRK